MAKTEVIGSGPSWYDVELYQEEIERAHDCQVLFLVTCAKVSGGGRRSWWVRTQAHTARQLDKPARAAAGWGFRGNGGATTMPAAMYMALVKLDEALCEIRDKASGQMAF